ncbi:MAG TPA: alpha/beta fold hydrolase [Kofleriaceae bacterium]|jgi:alpha-beta hydrolase superfamily lysophospholipase|nr:alpha/beta fold hydrolase [Kofleriaceae bacterium]
MAYHLEHLERDDLRLALHAWIPANVSAVVFYVHGIQSHGGWLFETGPYLANRGIAVYVLDRRGSGASEGVPGGADYGAWIDDYAHALDRARSAHAGVPLTVLGQSFGATVAAAVALRSPRAYDALALVAPALNQVRGARIVEPGCAPPALPVIDDDTLMPIPLDDTQYTRDPRYLAFMRDDHRMLRTISSRHRRTLLGLAAAYMAVPAAFARTPSALFLPRADSIISLPLARESFTFLAPGGLIVELPTEDHYLEFSAARIAYLEVLASFVLAPERLHVPPS